MPRREGRSPGGIRQADRGRGRHARDAERRRRRRPHDRERVLLHRLPEPAGDARAAAHARPRSSGTPPSAWSSTPAPGSRGWRRATTSSSPARRSARRCFWCRKGRPDQCEHLLAPARTVAHRADGTPVVTGIGTYAELITIRGTWAFPIDTDLPDTTLTLLGCGITTGVGRGGQRRRGAARGHRRAWSAAGTWVCGWSRARGSPGRSGSSPSSRSPGARTSRWQLGATDVVDPAHADPVEAVRELTDGRGADVTLGGLRAAGGDRAGLRDDPPRRHGGDHRRVVAGLDGDAAADGGRDPGQAARELPDGPDARHARRAALHRDARGRPAGRRADHHGHLPAGPDQRDQRDRGGAQRADRRSSPSRPEQPQEGPRSVPALPCRGCAGSSTAPRPPHARRPRTSSATWWSTAPVPRARAALEVRPSSRRARPGRSPSAARARWSAAAASRRHGAGRHRRRRSAGRRRVCVPRGDAADAPAVGEAEAGHADRAGRRLDARAARGRATSARRPRCRLPDHRQSGRGALRR